MGSCCSSHHGEHARSSRSQRHLTQYTKGGERKQREQQQQQQDQQQGDSAPPAYTPVLTVVHAARHSACQTTPRRTAAGTATHRPSAMAVAALHSPPNLDAAQVSSSVGLGVGNPLVQLAEPVAVAVGGKHGRDSMCAEQDGNGVDDDNRPRRDSVSSAVGLAQFNASPGASLGDAVDSAKPLHAASHSQVAMSSDVSTLFPDNELPLAVASSNLSIDAAAASVPSLGVSLVESVLRLVRSAPPQSFPCAESEATQVSFPCAVFVRGD